jgi:hypothetical protein
MPVESTIVKQAPILQGSASTKFLQGGVQHSEQLAPVQSGLKVGTTFDESKLEKIAPARIWYRVPPWMAGRWQYDDYTQTYFEDYKKGSIDSQAKTSAAQAGETWGSQHDRLGGVWDEMILPATKDTTADKDLYKDAHTDDSVIFDSDARFIVRLVSTRTRIDKATNTIRDVNQVEQFTTLLPAGPGKIRNDYSFKYFDPRGSKVSLSKGWRIGRKVAPFAPNNYDENNQDVRPAFRDYLKSNGLDNLVPLDQ